MKVASTIVAFLALFCVGKVNATPPLPTCTEDGLLYGVDLDTGAVVNNLGNQNLPSPLQGFSITQEVALSQGVSGSACDWEGVLRIAMPAAINGVQRRAVKFVITHDTALGFPSFHVGDSVTNEVDGSGAAEVFNDGSAWNVYADQQLGYPVPSYPVESGFVTENVELYISDKIIQVVSGSQARDYYGRYLFSLDGSPDYEFFLGMNRIIANIPGSSGMGLCRVKIFAATCNCR